MIVYKINSLSSPTPCLSIKVFKLF
uniref:Uncharacterized protein n=1 Tax=Rhizophora mucronata TaxID=61149 RepID=A0A2P2J5V8_RHIMU